MLEESRFPKLILLLKKGKRVQPGVLGSAIRAEFENIEKARNLGISWEEIAESLGFPGKSKLAGASYSRERRRRERQEGVTKPASGSGIQKNPVPAKKEIEVKYASSIDIDLID